MNGKHPSPSPDPLDRAPVSRLQSEWIIVGTIALLHFILHLAAIKGFGYFRDELYYLACSDRLGLGYVDQPALSLVFLRGIRSILGSSRFAIRLLPAIAGALWILGTGAITSLMGGRKWAVVLSSAAAFATTGNFFIFHTYSMNFWDLLFWQACFILLILIIRNQNPKLWITFGIVAGLGLENKISILFLLFGLGIGLLATRERRQLKSLYFWAGMVLAVLLFLPYILWNAKHDWPTLEFMANARMVKNAPVTPLEFFFGQVLYNHPLTLIFWTVGLGALLLSKRLKTCRPFGWLFLSIYFLFTIQEAKDYYLAAAYPVLFAAGGIQWDAWIKGKISRQVKVALVGLIVVTGLLLCPLTLPVLSVETTARFAERLGVAGQTSERHETGSLPQHFADMFGWEEWVKVFTAAWDQLDAADRSDCILFVRNYGEAGAIDFFGPAYGLPGASCTHNQYWFWGPPNWNGSTALIVGERHDIEGSREDLLTHFESVDYAATMRNEWAMPYENGRHVFICRRYRHDFSSLWEGEKHFN